MTGHIGEWLVFTRAHGPRIRVIQVYHRHYPEVRGEGRSAGEAAGHLARQLARGLEHSHGHGREALEQALAAAHARQPPEPQQLDLRQELTSGRPRGGLGSSAEDDIPAGPAWLGPAWRGRRRSSAPQEPAGPGGPGR